MDNQNKPSFLDEHPDAPAVPCFPPYYFLVPRRMFERFKELGIIDDENTLYSTALMRAHEQEKQKAERAAATDEAREERK